MHPDLNTNRYFVVLAVVLQSTLRKSYVQGNGMLGFLRRGCHIGEVIGPIAESLRDTTLWGLTWRHEARLGYSYLAGWCSFDKCCTTI